jgi:hypothetical protein
VDRECILPPLGADHGSIGTLDAEAVPVAVAVNVAGELPGKRHLAYEPDSSMPVRRTPSSIGKTTDRALVRAVRAVRRTSRLDMAVQLTNAIEHLCRRLEDDAEDRPAARYGVDVLIPPEQVCRAECYANSVRHVLAMRLPPSSEYTVGTLLCSTSQKTRLGIRVRTVDPDRSATTALDVKQDTMAAVPDLECNICFENARAVVCKPCGHNRFCRSCITSVCNKREKFPCPLCRGDVTQVEESADLPAFG